MSTDMAVFCRLRGEQFLAPGGHNWPDMQVVVDAAQTEVVDDWVYLISVAGRSGPEIKRLRVSGNHYQVHPAVTSFEPAGRMGPVRVAGVELPVVGSIEFSDRLHSRSVTVHGRMVGLWAGRSDLGKRV